MCAESHKHYSKLTTLIYFNKIKLISGVYNQTNMTISCRPTFQRKKKRLMERLIKLVIRFPRTIIILTLAITAFFANQLTKVDISASSDSLLIKADPERIYFDQVKEIFGDDQIIIIALVNKGEVFNAETVKKIKRITEKIERLDGVKRVISIANVLNIKGAIEEGEEILEIEPLIKEFPDSEEKWRRFNWKKLKEDAFENRLYLKNLISLDGKAAAVNVIIETMSEEELFNKDIVGKINAVIEDEKGPEAIYLAGIPNTKAATTKAMKGDIKKFLPFTFLLILIVVSLSFRSQRGITLPVVTVFLSVTWTVGLMGILQTPFSLITIILPSLLLAIGSAYVIHVMSQYFLEAREEAEKEDILRNALKHVSLPVVITALTTMAGFASLMVNRIPGIRQLGFFTIFGIFSTMMISLTFVPAVLLLLEKPVVKKVGGGEVEAFAKMLRRLGEFNLRHKPAILIFSLISSLIAGLGVFKIKVDTDFISYFDEDSEIRIARRQLHEHLAGGAPIYVIIDAGRTDALKEPALLQDIEGLQEYLEALKGIDKTISIADYIKLLNKAINNNDPRFEVIPRSKEEVAQDLLFYSLSGDPEDFDPYVNREYSKANILIRSNMVGSAEVARLIEKINIYAREHFPPWVTVKPTGTMLLLNKAADEVSLGQIKGLSMVTTVIFGVMALLFLSFKIGLLSMLPNIFPIVILFGIMGWTGVTLNFSTSIIAGIVIGIAVDDTIHYLTRFNREVKDTRNEEKAMFNTLASTGKPIIFTSLALFFGFIIVSLSNFKPIIHFGYLTASAMIICLFGDLVLLPALLTTVKIITLWDLIDLKLGEEPTRRIGLFQGLRNSQAKITVLMGSINRYQKGELVVTEGEIGSEMYVIITGGIEVFSGSGDRKQTIALLKPGDTFGEMALVRHSIRSASAIATEPTELLVVNERMLERLQKRYPRISSQVFLNLTKLLSDRLELTTATLLQIGRG
jgi:predicted RND superfamily exporter protein